MDGGIRPIILVGPYPDTELKKKEVKLCYKIKNKRKKKRRD